MTSKTCYGDFDNDGDIDDDDEAILDAAMNNDPTDNVLCDYDLDCRVGLLESFRFEVNRALGCGVVCGGAAAAGGGDPDVATMAAWSRENLTRAARDDYALWLLSIVRRYPQTPDAPQMLELADLLAR